MFSIWVAVAENNGAKERTKTLTNFTFSLILPLHLFNYAYRARSNFIMDKRGLKRETCAHFCHLLQAKKYNFRVTNFISAKCVYLSIKMVYFYVFQVYLLKQ